MAKQFLMNLLLSFIWVALTGEMYYTNLLFGFILGFFILWIMNLKGDDKRYFTHIPKAVLFAFYFLYKLLMANIQVAYDVVTPKYFFKPGIVRFPMEAATDTEINLLSTVISLTPGTLILDISDDRKVLFIHVMYLKDREHFISEIRNGLEKKLLELLR
ncbi:Na+/H+ antiporter subunit E [Flavobacterium sp.]|uniref:Na+/H+ antiporter subunit E n=1 Tax=Flavobacterium sp. TaxID=239 RepID=UPI00403385FB